jgi:hypothetical protein
MHGSRTRSRWLGSRSSGARPYRSASSPSSKATSECRWRPAKGCFRSPDAARRYCRLGRPRRCSQVPRSRSRLRSRVRTRKPTWSRLPLSKRSRDRCVGRAVGEFSNRAVRELGLDHSSIPVPGLNFIRRDGSSLTVSVTPSSCSCTLLAVRGAVETAISLRSWLVVGYFLHSPQQESAPESGPHPQADLEPAPAASEAQPRSLRGVARSRPRSAAAAGW